MPRFKQQPASEHPDSSENDWYEELTALVIRYRQEDYPTLSQHARYLPDDATFAGWAKSSPGQPVTSIWTTQDGAHYVYSSAMKEARIIPDIELEKDS